MRFKTVKKLFNNWKASLNTAEWSQSEAESIKLPAEVRRIELDAIFSPCVRNEQLEEALKSARSQQFENPSIICEFGKKELV